MSDLTGTLVDGRYRVDRKVAEGGSSTVYAGEHLGVGVPVAIKVLRAREAGDPIADVARADRFLEEARVLERLRHPHIIASLGAGFVGGEARGAAYIALAWCEGTTLAAHLASTRGTAPRSLREVWEVMAPIVDAVAHAHAHAVVHGDLTPANVMLDTSSGGVTPRLIDFGVADHAARAGGRGPSRSSDSPRAFTRAYAAPEQVTRAATGPFTDVHALGLIFLELLANRPPYGESEPELAIVDPQRPSDGRLGVDAGPFAPVIDRALRLDPSERFHDAAALAEALSAAASAALEATTAPRTTAQRSSGSSRPSRSSTSPRRGRFLVAMGIVGVVAIAAAVTLWVTQRDDAGPVIEIGPARTRLEKAGYRIGQSGRFFDGESLSIEAPSGATVDLSVRPSPDCRERDQTVCEPRIRDRIIRDFRRAAWNGFTVAYGADRDSTLTTWALDAAAARDARDIAIRGLELPIVGVVTSTDAPSGEGRAAARLAAFGPDELATQLKRAGLVVSWSGEGKGDLVAMATYTSGTELGTAYVYKGALTEILKSLQTQPEALAWAKSPDRMLVLRGTKGATAAAVLEKVVMGTDAVVAAP